MKQKCLFCILVLLFTSILFSLFLSKNYKITTSSFTIIKKYENYNKEKVILVSQYEDDNDSDNNLLEIIVQDTNTWNLILENYTYLLVIDETNIEKIILCEIKYINK
ncbi:MAG: hypothetical protein Q4F88_07165 [Eubacteriales bacterium]|nr:hypothetical protein [Eubacteriales bacterium]